jgi:sulfur carrier protein
VIRLSVNGRSRHLDSSVNIARLLESMQLAGKRVAVERNGEIVPRSRYDETLLAEGDRIEVVVAVGGG